MNGGHFTLPGEAGHERLTLDLAERWGADVIRDSDGTQLSEALLNTGLGIYSTICIIREHNAWIRQNMDARQQSFLCTEPRTATGNALVIDLMEDFFSGQFSVNEDAVRYLQVYDRTTGEPLPETRWAYAVGEGTVTVRAEPFHRYTVGFLAWRNWEEISMYNHTTNGWDKEHLMQLDPYHEKAMAYIADWLEGWCVEHPRTTVVRFTSLFYNFAWIWGSHADRRHVFADWASYDFTVSEKALDDFERAHGYRMTAEDFVNGGKYQATHSPPTRRKLDWMAFMSRFVRDAGKRLVDIVHRHGKKAYVFYDDSWVGLEPYDGHFEEYGFDGLIKCVFSGYEARLCAGVPVETHEIRLHPYLFPVGLGGAPTFSPGGTPELDARRYWIAVRRALLRVKIDRIGLGGYLHYAAEYPKFIEAMDGIIREFHEILALHERGAPHRLKPAVGVLTGWGKLRTWTLSGHFHETEGHVLIHILETLAGMPLEVKFLSFDDVREETLRGLTVLINAGRAGSAWSGGELWGGAAVQERLTRWVHEGGLFIGVEEPSACPGGDTYFRMAHVLGVDLDTGARCCHGKWPVRAQGDPSLVPAGVRILPQKNLYLTDRHTRVLLADEDSNPLLCMHDYGRGKGVYLAGYRLTPDNARLLQNLILAACGDGGETVTDDPLVECAVFPAAAKIVWINNGGEARQASCAYASRRYAARLAPYEMKVLPLNG